ncbi:MAG: type II toxin-antitoxin system RelE/ParE family toxin [Roseovarius sp.]|nr:type II toxin-antitoxin system RelE/ParE family toxin [Roseovarius sp.]
MKLVWSPQAEEDLYNIVEYIAGDNPVAAFDMFERITLTVAKILPGNPRAGRPGRADGTRELVVHENYIAACRISENRIDVLAVQHAARLR